MDTFDLEIVATDRAYYKGPCQALTIPCPDGEKGILAMHEPVVMAIIPGELRYTVDGETKVAAVGEGFADVTNKKVTVIASFAENPEEIDAEQAERATQMAREKLQMKTSELEYARIEADLARKLAELKVVKKKLQKTI